MIIWNTVNLLKRMWLNPHLVILDEPTNYLDRDGLGALTLAIKEFKGGVVIISHNREFADAVSQEKWIMEKGYLRKEGESTANQNIHNEDHLKTNIETMKDSMGNDIQIKRKEVLSDKDKKKKIKLLEKKIKKLKKSGCSPEEIYELEDELMEIQNS